MHRLQPLFVIGLDKFLIVLEDTRFWIRFQCRIQYQKVVDKFFQVDFMFLCSVIVSVTDISLSDLASS